MDLKEYVFRRRMKGCEIAKCTGLAPPLVSQILNGIVVCPKKHQEKLAKFLEVTVGEIQTNKILKQGGGNEKES